jgi:uncharacterized protein
MAIEPSLLVITALGLAGYLTGLGKSGFGGMGLLALWLVAEVFPARESTGIILPILILADIFSVWWFRQHTVWRHVWGLLPPAVLGVILGWWLMPQIPAEGFRRLIGAIILLMTGLMILNRAWPAFRNLTLQHPGLLWPTGLLAGVTTMLANAAGPIATLYLLACRLPKLEFVGTAAVFFFAINLIKVPFSASLGLITWSTLLWSLSTLPLIYLGIQSGRWLLHRISQNLFEALLLLFTLAGGLRLVW